MLARVCTHVCGCVCTCVYVFTVHFLHSCLSLRGQSQAGKTGQREPTTQALRHGPQLGWRPSYFRSCLSLPSAVPSGEYTVLVLEAGSVGFWKKVMAFPSHPAKTENSQTLGCQPFRVLERPCWNAGFQRTRLFHLCIATPALGDALASSGGGSTPVRHAFLCQALPRAYGL